METIEYRVRPVTRFIVTEYREDPEKGCGSCGSIGEFDNINAAHAVGLALHKAAPTSSFRPLANSEIHAALAVHEEPTDGDGFAIGGGSGD